MRRRASAAVEEDEDDELLLIEEEEEVAPKKSRLTPRTTSGAKSKKKPGKAAEAEEEPEEGSKRRGRPKGSTGPKKKKKAAKDDDDDDEGDGDAGRPSSAGAKNFERIPQAEQKILVTEVVRLLLMRHHSRVRASGADVSKYVLRERYAGMKVGQELLKRAGIVLQDVFGMQLVQEEKVSQPGDGTMTDRALFSSSFCAT